MMILLLLAVFFVRLSAATASADTDTEFDIQTFIRDLPKDVHGAALQHRAAELLCEKFAYKKALRVMREIHRKCEWSCESREEGEGIRDYITALASSRGDTNVDVWPASVYFHKKLPILDGLSFVEDFLSLQEACTAHDDDLLEPFEEMIIATPGGEEMLKLVTENRDAVRKLNAEVAQCNTIQILLVLGGITAGPRLFSLVVSLQTFIDQQEKSSRERLLSFNTVRLAKIFTNACSSRLEPCLVGMLKHSQKILHTHNFNSINRLI